QEEVDMESLCEQAYSAFSEEARRRAIDYTRDVDSHPVIVTDGDRVLQIISNLLQNAFRWTPDGGRIELSLAQSNGNVNVEVDDTGPGISAEERERIFRPFVSRDGAGGTGLGPGIARELAAALGGRIELDSEPGRGSRFRLVLPASRLLPLPGGRPSVPASLPWAPPPPPGRRGRARCGRGRRATPDSPPEGRGSTSRPRSSTRALRSARTSPSSRSS